MKLTPFALCDIRITLIFPPLCPLCHCQIHVLLFQALHSPRSLHPHVWLLYIDALSHAALSETKTQLTVGQLHLTVPQATQIQLIQKLNSILQPLPSLTKVSHVIDAFVPL